VTLFGTSVVRLTRYVKTGAPDALGQYQLIPIVVDAPGCRHRPLTFQESAEYNLDIATQPWKTTLPTHEYDGTILAALAALKPEDAIVVDGQEYQIVGGMRPFEDLAGNPFKATIVSQKQTS
jgi:hypothetical protein